MRYSAGALNDVSTPLWFCLRAQPKREHIAAQSLRRQHEVTCFAPRVKYRKATQRGAGWFVEAMFPGYLFAQFVYAEFHRRVQAAPGIVSLVRFGDYVPVIEAEAIDIMRQSSSDDEVITVAPEIKPGDPVLVVDGAFQGLSALVTQLYPAKERVRILLDFLGRQIEAEMPLDRVLPADVLRARRSIADGKSGPNGEIVSR